MEGEKSKMKMLADLVPGEGRSLIGGGQDVSLPGKRQSGSLGPLL